jgi:hypothetical protein
MQGPPTSNEDDEASVRSEYVQNGEHLSAGSHKAAKHTLPLELTAEDTIKPAVLPPLQDEDIKETKRPRLEMPFPASTGGEATTKNASHDSTVALRAAIAMLALCQILHCSIDPTSARAGRWTTDEDTKLKNAVQMHDE